MGTKWNEFLSRLTKRPKEHTKQLAKENSDFLQQQAAQMDADAEFGAPEGGNGGNDDDPD